MIVPNHRLAALVRVLIFYLTALLALLLVGGLLQVTLGLPGVVLSQLLIFAALPLFFTAVIEKRPIRPFLRLRPLRPSGLLRAVFLGTVGWLAAQLMGAALILLVKLLGGEMVETYEILLDASPWVALLAGALLPAICEELSFRGYVLGALRPLGPTAAVILTGLMFGALHLSLIRLIPLSLLGMLWALSVQRTGSILPGMIMHLLNNGIALGLTCFTQGQANPADLQSLDAFPAAATWGAVVVLGLMAAGLAVSAYYVAAGFSPRDLRYPEALEEEWGWQEQAQPMPVFDPEAAESAELRQLTAELAALRSRRRRLLGASALLLGGVTLSIYLWAAAQELAVVFG